MTNVQDYSLSFASREKRIRIFDLLRCASAVVYEFGDQHEGTQRDLPFAAMYLIDMAKALANELLSQLQEPRTT